MHPITHPIAMYTNAEWNKAVHNGFIGLTVCLSHAYVMQVADDR